MKKIILILILFLIVLPIIQIKGQEKTKPGKVEITWEEKTVSVCPPGIFGLPPCQYPDIIDVVKRVNEFILNLAPIVLVILIILGGFYYLLTPFEPKKMIEKGHSYIKWAVYGYIILLLVSLIFTFIRAIFGGPGK